MKISCVFLLLILTFALSGCSSLIAEEIQISNENQNHIAKLEPTPIIKPILEPTLEPIIEPTSEPIIEPTPEPTLEPIIEPTLEPDNLDNKNNKGIIALEWLNNMTLAEKVGQLFFCSFRRDANGDGITEITDDIISVIRDYHIGGVVLFSENIKNITQVTDYISNLQKNSDIPLFIGVDEEGGRVTRTASLDNPTIPSAFSIGNLNDINKAYDTATIIADYLNLLGFNVNFAPVADIWSNPENKVIGDRAFSSDAIIASDMVVAFSSGLLDNGILPTIKHFPGHGDTNEDSHYGLAQTTATLEELHLREFLPFKAGINAGVPFVMMGHISTPNIVDNYEPAIFSEFLIKEVLRGQLEFSGIIITDALDMGAVTEYYSSAETAKKAILAGVDMLLMPQDFYSAFNAIIEAVNTNEISMERIDESVLRILKFKMEFLADN